MTGQIQGVENLRSSMNRPADLLEQAGGRRSRSNRLGVYGNWRGGKQPRHLVSLLLGVKSSDNDKLPPPPAASFSWPRYTLVSPLHP